MFLSLLACRAPLGDSIGTRSAALYQLDEVQGGLSDVAEVHLGVAPAAESLADFERLALLDNPGLGAAYQRYVGAVARANQEGYWPEPQFGYAGFVEAIQTRTGPQQHRFSLTQKVPLPGRLSARERRARALAEAAWHDVLAEVRAVRLAVRRAYFDFAFASRDRELAQRMLDLLRGLSDVVRRRVEGGAPQADLLRLAVQIGELEDRVVSLDEMRPVHSSRLATLLNRPTEVLPWPALDEPPAEPVPAIAVLRQRLLGTNPTLQALSQRVVAAEAGIDEAELAGYPDVTLGADLFATGEAPNPNTAGSGDDPVALRIQFALPIYRAKYAAQRQAAAAQREQSVSVMVARRTALDRELVAVRFRASEAARRVALYRNELLPRARQALEVTQAAYVSGSATFLAVIDSQQTLLAMEQTYWRACADDRIGRAELAALCGGEQ